MKTRLPTEAEWEYACRAGSTTRFSYGDDEGYRELGDHAWYDKNSDYKTHPVGQKKPNAWGLFDMHGNVWEWCADWLGQNYYKESPAVDPTGPDDEEFRVKRGGCYYHDARSCASHSRDGGLPKDGYRFIGFRVVVLAGAD
jgi:formylglycine-generating enzyme required for sulfatase activity